MNDFIFDAVPWIVTAVTLLGALACAGFLWLQSRQKVRFSMDADDNTTGHVWDEDLRELNNPMPRWWMGLFYITVAFAIGYLALYPGLATMAGQLGWTSKGQYEAEVKALNAQTAPLYARFDSMSVEAIAQDRAAMDMGGRLFLNNCAQCHGSDARGSKGYPNLTDSDWLYGGAPDTIRASITQGRHGMMPPMIQAIGGDEQARQVAQYVLSLSGRETDAVKAQLGRTLFNGVCAACHGAGGVGNQAIGAPNLSDRTWLHGGTESAILETIRKGRSGEMPAHADKLNPLEIKVLSAYIWRFSHSQ